MNDYHGIYCDCRRCRHLRGERLRWGAVLVDTVVAIVLLGLCAAVWFAAWLVMRGAMR